MPRWHAKLDVPELWQAQQILVYGGGYPWGVCPQCTPGGQVHTDLVFRLRWGAGVGRVECKDLLSTINKN